MEAPPIQYTTTSDGVSVAWAEAGQGRALLVCPATPFSHVQEEFAVLGPLYGALAGSFRVVVFDARGTGMSERDVAALSGETLLLDAEAVIGAAKLDRFVALAVGGNPLAVSICLRLATAFPERVTHVVLDSPFQNMRDLADTPLGRVGLALAELDWAVFTQTFFRVLLGYARAEWVESFVAAVGGWADPSVGVQYIREWEAVDVSDLLAQVRQPALVLRLDPYVVPARVCQRVAAKIPGAQFRQYSDPTFAQWAELIRTFVGEPSSPPAQEAPAASPFRTVLFTDLVGHTQMMSRLGDDRGREVLREHERITREVLKANGGTELKTMGDGFMASFGSVTKAVECAIALQRAFAEREGEPLSVRVGLNAGEPIEEDGDLFGATVILASRIAAQADGGEILIPEPVRHLLSGKPFVYADRGEFVPKGFDDAVRLFEVRWQEDA
jgi:class 3 adenylate cyclase